MYGSVRARTVAVVISVAVAAVPSIAVGGASTHGRVMDFTTDRAEGVDQPDVTDAPQTHVIYFVPADKPDEDLDSNGTLAGAIDGIRKWFARETSSAGMPAIRPRFDRTASGDHDITFLRGMQNSDAYPSIDQIVDELVSLGFNKPNKRYLIYAATTFRRNDVPQRRCAESYYRMEGFAELPYAVVHLDSPESCGARAFGSVDKPGRSGTLAAHEWLHLEGVTPMGAAHYCATSLYHVCTGPVWALAGINEPADIPQMDPEARDIMFPILDAPLHSMVLDRVRDDYLDHGLPTYDLRDSPWFE